MISLEKYNLERQQAFVDQCRKLERKIDEAIEATFNDPAPFKTLIIQTMTVPEPVVLKVAERYTNAGWKVVATKVNIQISPASE